MSSTRSTASEHSLALIPGTMLGHYRIERVLGSPGGFGITYLAEDVNLETLVAIKEFLPRDLAGRGTDRSTVVPHSQRDQEFFRKGLEWFLKEARTLARLDHPNVVRVKAFFEAHGTAYMVMHYYEGQTLSEVMRSQGGRLPWELAAEVMVRLLDGLASTHAKDVLHRDVKPDNIYITAGGQPVLLDFGAARQAMGDRNLTAIFTPGYAPIEQYGQKGRQGPWTDVYACAAVLYAAITGERPPDASDRIGEDPLQPPSALVPDLPPHIDAAIMRSLAMDYTRRPQTVRELQDLLLHEDRMVAPVPPPVPRPQPPVVPVPPAPPPLGPTSGGARSTGGASTGSTSVPSGGRRGPTGEGKSVPPDLQTAPEPGDGDVAVETETLEPPRNKMGMVLIAVAVLALGGGGAFYAMSKSGERPIIADTPVVQPPGGGGVEPEVTKGDPDTLTKAPTSGNNEGKNESKNETVSEPEDVESFLAPARKSIAEASALKRRGDYIAAHDSLLFARQRISTTESMYRSQGHRRVRAVEALKAQVADSILKYKAACKVEVELAFEQKTREPDCPE